MTSTTYRIDQTRGSLTDSDCIYSEDVLLDLRIAKLRGDSGIDDEAIANVSITFGSRVPADGTYTVNYTWKDRPLQNQLRIIRQKATVAFIK
jgi:hypothetical protein